MGSTRFEIEQERTAQVESSLAELEEQQLARKVARLEREVQPRRTRELQQVRFILFSSDHTTEYSTDIL